MGYRSEVALSLSENANELFLENLKEIPEIQTLVNNCEWSDPNHGRYYWSWVKWYDSYPEVDAMEKFLDFLDAVDHETYGFVRIGEDEEDISRRGSPCVHDMYVNRSIEW